jgi:hypothetical protein
MNRETWLIAALAIVRNHLRDTAAVVVPDTTYVSCGFPGGGSARTRIGECWAHTQSADDRTEIFISPVLSDSLDVMAVLVHEAVHAAVGCEHGHKAPFKRAAVAAGLEGKMTATTASDALKATMREWIESLGAYPHAALSLSSRKKQSTRMIKCECATCKYVVRTTQKWIDFSGAPICPTVACDGARMVYTVEESEDSE